MSITLTQLILAARLKADMRTSEFRSDTEITSMINNSAAELYDLLVSRFEDYYTIAMPFTIAAGSDGYALPSNFYKVRGLDKALSGPTDWVSVSSYQFEERNKYNNRINTYARGGRSVLECRLIKNTIKVLPPDQAPGSYQLWYIPKYTDLVSGADTTDDLQHWEEYVSIDVAIKLLTQEESDVSVLVMEKQQMKQRIEAMAANRDAGRQDRVQDVSNSGWDWDL